MTCPASDRSSASGGYPVLFLDIDGVLRPADEPVLDHRGQLLPGATRLQWLPALARVIGADSTRVNIIVSSDWCRIVDDDGLRALLGPLGTSFIGAMEVSPRLSRAQGIEQYAAHHRIGRWLALDDDVSVKTASRRNSRFVWCDPSKGAGEQRVQDRVAAFLARDSTKR